MAETYTELLEKDFARQIEFLNVKKYHELGYKGKGITIFNAESLSDHGQMTTGVIKDYAPEATVLNGWTSSATSGNKVKYVKINVNEEVLDFEEAIDKYNIKIMTISKSGSYSKATLEYYKDVQKRKGIIMFTSAGNEGDDVGVWARENTAIAVSASTLKENKNIVISYYGSPNEVDFTCFMARGRGTSASSPALSALTALLLNRYGDFNQEECVEILKSIAIDLGDKLRAGWGLPILPLTKNLPILDELRNKEGSDNMEVTPQDILDRQLKFLNVDKYHEQGFTGKGLVAFNSESHIGESNKHGKNTNMVLHQFAPDVIIINGTTGGRTSGNKVIEYYVITTDGVKYDFEEFIVKFNVKLMTTSLGNAQANKAIQDYLKGVQERTGLIQFNSAGNEGSKGADGKYVKNDTAIAVGAGYIRDNGDVDITHYSAIDDEIDFIFPMGTYSGTSASSPALTGFTACLLQRYGDFTQKECVEILKSIAKDIGVEGKDPENGWGTPILPLTDRLAKLDELREIKKDEPIIENPIPEIPIEEPIVKEPVVEEPIVEKPKEDTKPTDYIDTGGKYDYFIALEAGHGIVTSGKRTFTFDDGTFMREWEFNSAVMQKVYKKLIPYKRIDVFIVNSEKYDIDLDVRVKRINNAWQTYQDKLGKNNVKGAMISIHANAEDTKTWSSGNGTATFHYPTNMIDKAFAEVIQKNLIAQTGLKSHREGVVGGNFQIIRESKITTCLCECAFMTNLKEAELLRTNEFREKCAEGIFNGILEYFNIKKIGEEVKEPIVEQPIVDNSIGYSRSANNTFQQWGNPKQLGTKIVNQKNNTIEEPYSMNSIFFWWENPEKTKCYPTSIYIKDGVILRNEANHLDAFGTPQNVFIVYKNGKVEMKKVKYATELDYKNIVVGVGCVGLKDSTNPNFKYDPASEGFKKGKHLQTGVTVDYSDVLRKTTKAVIGYNIKEDKVYIMMRPDIYHSNPLYYDLLELVNDCKFDIAGSLDGGNSCFYNNADDMVLVGSGRVIYSIIGFNLK